MTTNAISVDLPSTAGLSTPWPRTKKNTFQGSAFSYARTWCMKPTFFTKMKVAAAILLVCIVIQNVSSLSPFPPPPSRWMSVYNKVKGRGREIADEVGKHVDKASKTMSSHGERLMEYKKTVNGTLTEGKEHFNKLWKKNKDRWSSKAEEEWLKFRNRTEEGLELVKEGVHGIEEILDTNLPERPHEVIKAIVKKLKEIVLAVEEIYKEPKTQGSEEKEELLQAEVTEEESEEPQPIIPEEDTLTVPTPEHEVYPEEFEPTEVLTTPTAEWSTEFPVEKPIMVVCTFGSGSGEEEESGNDEYDANSGEDESDKDSPLDLLHK